MYRSFISIHYQLNPPRETYAKPKFASKISSLDVSNNPRSHSPRHTTVEFQLVTLPPLQIEPPRGPYRHAT